MKNLSSLLKRIAFIILMAISGFFFSLGEPGSVAIGLLFFGLLLWVSEKIYSEYKNKKGTTAAQARDTQQDGKSIEQKRTEYTRSAEIFIFALSNKITNQIAIDKRILPYQMEEDDKYKLCQYFFGAIDYVKHLFGKEVNIDENLYMSHTRVSCICYGCINNEFIQNNARLSLDDDSSDAYLEFYSAGINDMKRLINDILGDGKSIDEIDSFLIDFEDTFMPLYRLSNN